MWMPKMGPREQLTCLNKEKIMVNTLFDTVWPYTTQKYWTYLVYLPFVDIFAQYWPYICLMHPIFGPMTQIFGSILAKYTIFDIPWPKAFQKYILYWVRMVHILICAWPELFSFPPPTAKFGSKLPDQNRSAPRQNQQ